MKIINNSDSVIIVLHEIYGINQHIQMVCKKFSMNGYDIICPNLIDKPQPFNYDLEQEAYEYFMNNIGFDSAVQQVKQVIIQAKKQYKNIYLIGYSVGATIAWLCSGEENMCNGIIGYYGSRIRDYRNITPKCPVLLIFSTEENSFNIKELVYSLKKQSINVYMLKGKHGFSNPFYKNYCEQSFEKAEKLVDNFLKKINNGPSI
ncbi:dienelactone hydrolase [Clostridium tetanomorphum]|uniref:dienelactone hydrolase family protein n=1 Tax=Clostridium tetanomorphum TaxID=1553 RepID=UPI000A104242|nr:dienelactone hydrolase family protein [Clostridium tetanomorphum]MBP1864327.1 dienelactone hydrolase [Clostridium tetanomorphum]NRS83773.1 dienelactone hydrolase [Clostridium tetanomorphum]NRZ96964.1 dienelactone hydrolase [Clostridium tetanomorphum]SQC02196.1 dienelactone hydrolase-like enzyme [Clostridium tetanomorphum]